MANDNDGMMDAGRKILAALQPLADLDIHNRESTQALGLMILNSRHPEPMKAEEIESILDDLDTLITRVGCYFNALNGSIEIHWKDGEVAFRMNKQQSGAFAAKHPELVKESRP